jgi:Tfp pilus assembly protein PilP
MVISDVLMINVLDQTLNTEAGRPLFRMMLQHAARLRVTPGRKTTLLFVVRDLQSRLQEAAHALDVRRQRIDSMLRDLWNVMLRRTEAGAEAGAGEGAENVPFDDLFDVRVFCVPPMVFLGSPVPQAEAFVAELREWFFNPTNPNYLFKIGMVFFSFSFLSLLLHTFFSFFSFLFFLFISFLFFSFFISFSSSTFFSSPSVAPQGKHYADVAEALQYSANLWPGIKANKDLRVLDEYRLHEQTQCAGMATAMLDRFQHRMDGWNARLAQNVGRSPHTAWLNAAVGGLLAEVDSAVAGTLAQFAGDAPHVCEDVYTTERAKFAGKLAEERGRFEKTCSDRICDRHVKECADVYDAAMQRLRTRKSSLEDEMRRAVASEEETIRNPTQDMTDARDAEVTQYRRRVGTQPWSVPATVAEKLQALKDASAPLVDEIKKSYEHYKAEKLRQIHTITSDDVKRVGRVALSSVGSVASVVAAGLFGALSVVAAPVALPALFVIGAAAAANGLGLGESIGEVVDSSKETKRKEEAMKE